jgi:predicted GIY-YIG superfamily endonuclease
MGVVPVLKRKRKSNVKGTVYLIHFDTHLAHARHYLGWTEGDDIDARIESHKSGSGACILRACNENDIEYEVVRTWSNVDRFFERWLKNQKGTKFFCPCCNHAAENRGTFEAYEETL